MEYAVFSNLKREKLLVCVPMNIERNLNLLSLLGMKEKLSELNNMQHLQSNNLETHHKHRQGRKDRHRRI